MQKQHNIFSDTSGYAVVEATILFPIIMLIFAGLVFLSVYLPTRAVLQQNTQYAATALATEQSDTWLDFDTKEMKYDWISTPNNVYSAFLAGLFTNDLNSDATTIVTKQEGKSLTSHSGNLKVECEVMNFVVYKEIRVTATRTIPVPVDLSFVKFPREIPITVSSAAVVLNGDEFVRNMDLAAELVKKYMPERLQFEFDKLGGFLDNVYKFFGV